MINRAVLKNAFRFCLLGLCLEAAWGKPPGQLPKAAPPVFKPPGHVYVREVDVSLSTTTPGGIIYYNPYNKDPDTVEGVLARRYKSGIVISITVTIRARTVAPGFAPSDVVTETYTRDMVARVLSADYVDWEGDGRIDRAIMGFSIPMHELPDQLDFKIVDQNGAVHQRTAKRSLGEIGYMSPTSSTETVVAKFTDPFPFGVTSVVNGDSSGRTYPQDNIPLTGFYFPMNEGAPPMILGAQVLESGPANPGAIVYLKFSERVKIPMDAFNPVTFSRQGVARPASEVRFRKFEMVGDMMLALHLDPAGAYQPVAGDSVSIKEGGPITDLGGASARMLVFRTLEKTSQTSIVSGFRAGMGNWLTRNEGRLQGGWLASHSPNAINCFTLDGTSLGAAQPSGSAGVWNLPSRQKAMVLDIRMRNGARIPFILP